jgi:hypothetical protein
MAEASLVRTKAIFRGTANQSTRRDQWNKDATCIGGDREPRAQDCFYLHQDVTRSETVGYGSKLFTRA